MTPIGSSVIDAHLHLWDLDRRVSTPTTGAKKPYPWLTPALGDLHRSHLPQEARGVLDDMGGHRAIIVQAEDSPAETDLLLDWAEQHDWILGVVGWLPLRDPAATAQALDDLAGRPLVGVRHLVHDDPDAGFLDDPNVRESLSIVAECGLPLDVPDAWPRHLEQLTVLALDLPDLVVVVDHLAKPPRAQGRDAMAAWAQGLAAAATLPNVVAKVSGLQCAGAPLTTEALSGVLDLALALFGADRLMYGSDWPMTTLHEQGPAHHWAAIRGWLDGRDPGEQRAVLSATAARTYRLA